MYVTIKAYNNIKAKTEDFDTIPLCPTGPESKSLKEGMYSFEGEYSFEILYDQLKSLKDGIISAIGSNETVDVLDIDCILGPSELKKLRAELRKKAVMIIDPKREDDEFIFAFSHFMKALDIAAYKKGVILIK